MSGLVMDGVRRRSQNGGILSLKPVGGATEAVLPMPQTWLPNTTSFDGLRRVAEAVATPASTDVYEPDELLEVVADRGLPRYAIASLAAIPMLTAATIGVRSYLARPSAVASVKAPTIAAAEPVPSDTQAALAPPVQSGLQQLLDGFGQSATYSLYVKDLKTGQLATVGPDRSFRSASFYKLFVASEIYRRIDAGSLSYNSPAGNGNTIAGCLNLMITISDNGCGDALGSLIGWNSLTQTLRAGGYSGTNLNQPMVTTPRDVSKLFERLYTGTLNSAGSNAQFLNLLKAQKVNNRLPQGLPAGATFAHKTGDLDGFMHDGGIVFGPKTDYLVVMMGAPGATTGNFANLSSKLYDFFEK